MNKTQQLKELQYENATLKQFIVLLNGQAALERIEKEIAVDRTNRALSIKDPKEFQDYTELFANI